MLTRLRASSAGAALSVFAIAAPAMAVVNIEYVPVGNPGNASDPSTGIGLVTDSFLIGKYEVTNAQYAEFLNAADPAGHNTWALYNSQMSTNVSAGGIDFVPGNAAGSKYVVHSGEGNRPVTFVSWYDAARMANWLHNGQGTGSTESGVYPLTGTTSISGGRLPGSTVFIPTEDEWYKAAYHQPATAGGDADNYWLYPTGTNTEPHSDNPASLNTPDNTNVANFYRDDGTANGYNDGYAVTGSTSHSSTANYLTDAGAYTLADSFYGTFDQGGNVWEWNETVVSGSSRGVRAGSWELFYGFLRADDRLHADPSLEEGGVGFRLASIPEPAFGVMLLTLAGAALVGRRARR